VTGTTIGRIATTGEPESAGEFITALGPAGAGMKQFKAIEDSQAVEATWAYIKALPEGSRERRAIFLYLYNLILDRAHREQAAAEILKERERPERARQARLFAASLMQELRDTKPTGYALPKDSFGYPTHIIAEHLGLPLSVVNSYLEKLRYSASQVLEEHQKKRERW